MLYFLLNLLTLSSNLNRLLLFKISQISYKKISYTIKWSFNIYFSYLYLLFFYFLYCTHIFLIERSFHYGEHIKDCFHLFIKFLKVWNVHLNIFYYLWICFKRYLLSMNLFCKISFNWIKVGDVFGRVEWRDVTK
jgi:hypothetical protein